MARIRVLFIGLILGMGIPDSVPADYPLIQVTSISRDPLYAQQQQDVEDWYAGRGDGLPLILYRYVPRRSEDLFAVAAAFNLPYESVATLNGWDAPGLLSPGVELLVPNQPGVFVPETPRTRWEQGLVEDRSEVSAVSVVIDDEKSSRRWLFYPGERFSSSERIRFLGSLFSSPLELSDVTSPFGYRSNPFLGGTAFHPGIDLRADIGTPVKAARSGVVSQTGTLEIYGLFVIISHDGGYESVYAHLDRILVDAGQAVEAGETIALSGNSGISTGPHLHFEIRKNGIPADPMRLTALRD